MIVGMGRVTNNRYTRYINCKCSLCNSDIQLDMDEHGEQKCMEFIEFECHHCKKLHEMNYYNTYSN